MVELELTSDIVQKLVDRLTTELAQAEDNTRFWSGVANERAERTRVLSRQNETLGMEVERLRGLVYNREDRIRSMEAEIQRLKFPMTVAEFPLADLDGLGYIAGIKLLRERTGAGLREAKEAVDLAVMRGYLTKVAATGILRDARRVAEETEERNPFLDGENSEVEVECAS